MATSVRGVLAAGDCVEVPQGFTMLPLQGLSGSHAYAQGNTAGTNAANGQRRYDPVFVPWGLVAGKWMSGGVSFGQTTAPALRMPYHVGVPTGSDPARYSPRSPHTPAN